MNKIEGALHGKGLRFAVIISRFNGIVTNRLLDGALDCLQRHGVDDKNIDIYYVPGVWEVPYMAGHLVRLKDKAYDAYICLGAVIRGQTPHFEYVASESAKGIANLSLQNDVVLSYGIVTSDTLEQALDRAGAKAGNKGWDAAISALEMVNLYKQVK